MVSFALSSRLGEKVVLTFVGIRNFIVQTNVDLASDEARMRREKGYLNKLNLVLVQVSASLLYSKTSR
jgi:hypothetical protein